jgi:hypothetical protein
MFASKSVVMRARADRPPPAAPAPQLPLALPWGWWNYSEWRAEQEKRAELERLKDGLLIMPIIDEQGEPGPQPGRVTSGPRGE